MPFHFNEKGVQFLSHLFKSYRVFSTSLHDLTPII